MYSFKAKEAVLYVVKQVLDEISDYDTKIGPDLANAYLDFARMAMQDGELISPCSSEGVQRFHKQPNVSFRIDSALTNSRGERAVASPWFHCCRCPDQDRW